MRQSTTHEFHFDASIANVHYMQHDGSIYIDDFNDNAVQIHGVTKQHLLQLVRNIFCAVDSLDEDDITKSYEWKQLYEIKAAVDDIVAKKPE